MNFTNNLEEAEKIEKIRNKMLKYILYKKRSEEDVRNKFANEDENIVEDAIEYFKELNYINDNDYIERAIKEFIALKKLSIKEVEYKICSKGINKNLVDDYICSHKENMVQYEIESAKAIILKKKSSLEDNEIKDYLYKKGYMSETISIAFDEVNS